MRVHWLCSVSRDAEGPASPLTIIRGRDSPKEGEELFCRMLVGPLWTVTALTPTTCSEQCLAHSEHWMQVYCYLVTVKSRCYLLAYEKLYTHISYCITHVYVYIDVCIHMCVNIHVCVYV